jgi:hypothetical protein
VNLTAVANKGQMPATARNLLERRA